MTLIIDFILIALVEKLLTCILIFEGCVHVNTVIVYAEVLEHGAAEIELCGEEMKDLKLYVLTS